MAALIKGYLPPWVTLSPASHETGPHAQIAHGSATGLGGKVFKYLLISIVIVPVLLGIKAADIRSGSRGLRVLIGAWGLYGTLWLAMLYYLKHHWIG